MLEGLYSAAAGMAAQQQRMDALANDVANVNTAGYKRQRTGFRDLVYQQAARGAAAGVELGSGVAAMTVGRSMAPGQLRETGNPLDFSIEGPGFFLVRLPNGQEGLTRDGSFHLDSRGRVVTANGAQVGITVPADTDPSDI